MDDIAARDKCKMLIYNKIGNNPITKYELINILYEVIYKNNPNTEFLDKDDEIAYENRIKKELEKTIPFMYKWLDLFYDKQNGIFVRDKDKLS